MNVLFLVSEAYPLVKTGGLADVVGALPAALAELGEEVANMGRFSGDRTIHGYASEIWRIEPMEGLER